MCKESILEKIKKLLNMTSENGCSEGEALSALAKARQLMLKYKIEEEELVDTTEKDIIQVELDTYNITIQWVYKLIMCISENFGVMRYILQKGRVKHFVLFGLKEEVECVIEIINCAYNFAVETSGKYMDEYKEIFGTSKGVRRSWYEGFIIGLRTKYKEQNETNQQFALMLRVDKDVQNAYDKIVSGEGFEKKEKSFNNRNMNNLFALNDGFNHGKSFGTTPIPETV